MNCNHCHGLHALIEKIKEIVEHEFDSETSNMLVSSKTAESGSIYVYCDDLTIRISNHAANRTDKNMFSCDPFSGHNLEDAFNWFLKKWKEE